MRQTIMRAPFVLAITLALLAIQPAAAAPPIREDFSFSLADQVNADCGSFQILWSGTIVGHTTTFSDAAGTPIRVQTHVVVNARIANSVTGKSLKDLGRITDTVDLVTGEQRQVGLIFQTTVPGLGTIVKDVGVLIFNPDGTVIIRGPHEAFAAGNDYAIFCPYLA